MTRFIVCRLDDSLVRRLKLRAARCGRSVEEECREILRAAVFPERSKGTLKGLLLGMPDVGEDSDFARPGGTGRGIDL